MIPPGETIGILGGGQLGRMLAKAAAQLGYRVHIYSPETEAIAADVCAQHTRAAWNDTAALAAFAADCAGVTYEFENVPVAALRSLGAVPLHPNARALEVAQDRVNEKEFVEAARALGASTPRQVVRHILPNALAPLIVQGTFIAASALAALACSIAAGRAKARSIP